MYRSWEGELLKIPMSSKAIALSCKPTDQGGGGLTLPMSYDERGYILLEAVCRHGPAYIPSKGLPVLTLDPAAEEGSGTKSAPRQATNIRVNRRASSKEPFTLVSRCRRNPACHYMRLSSYAREANRESFTKWQSSYLLIKMNSL